MSDENHLLGFVIQEARKRKGMNQAELARRVGLSRERVRQLEKSGGSRFLARFEEVLGLKSEILETLRPARKVRYRKHEQLRLPFLNEYAVTWKKVEWPFDFSKSEYRLALGKMVSQRRSELWLNKGQLASKAGVSKAAVSNMENGKYITQSPSKAWVAVFHALGWGMVPEIQDKGFMVPEIQDEESLYCKDPILLGQKIQDHRESKGMIKFDLAKLAGVSFSVVCKIEEGRYPINNPALSKVLAALELEIE